MGSCFGLTKGSCGSGYELIAVDTKSGVTEVIFRADKGGVFGPATVAVPYRGKLYAIPSEIVEKDKLPIKITKATKKAEAFESDHFDEPNIVVHARLNDRTDSEGNKVLFVEEIQSDWGAAGHKARIKEVSINKFNGNQVIPSYNEKGCNIFDKISKENNIHIQHAMNGGEFHAKELGYWVDGYDEENNIVYEYDEEHHFINGKLLEKDTIRQQEIEHFLNCKFIRFKE
jgi:hypothetical protein